MVVALVEVEGRAAVSRGAQVVAVTRRCVHFATACVALEDVQRLGGVWCCATRLAGLRC